MTEDQGGDRKLWQRSLCQPWLHMHRHLDDSVRKMIQRKRPVHGELWQLTDGEGRALVIWLAKLTCLSCGDLPSSTNNHKAVLLSMDASRIVIQKS